MADDDGAAAPARHQRGNGSPPLAVEIVGGLVEQDEIRLLEDEGGKLHAGHLPAGKCCKGRPSRRLQTDARKCCLQPGFEHPVGRGKLVHAGQPFFRTLEDAKRIADAKQVGDGFIVRDLDGLAEHAEAADDGDLAGLRRERAFDQAQQRGFANAVAADKAGTNRTKGQVEIGKEASALRRGPRKLGE